MSEDLDQLWGSRMQGFQFDPTVRELRINALALDSGVEHFYTLIAASVSQFSFITEILDPWNYAELTEVEVETTENGLLRLTLILWTEGNEIDVICKSYELQVTGGA